MTTKEVIDAIIEELGIRVVILQGAKTARVEYVIQLVDSETGRLYESLESLI